MMGVEDIDLLIVEAEKELARLDSLRAGVAEQIRGLRQKRGLLLEGVPPEPSNSSRLVTTKSPPEHKIALFMSRFRGWADVFPKRFESQRIGKSGYQPVCKNEWIKGLCRKPKTKCGSCHNRELVPSTAEAVNKHLIGGIPGTNPGGTSP